MQVIVSRLLPGWLSKDVSYTAMSEWSFMCELHGSAHGISTRAQSGLPLLICAAGRPSNTDKSDLGNWRSCSMANDPRDVGVDGG